jgi:nucleotide-binding universal stress UspA family protein
MKTTEEPREQRSERDETATPAPFRRIAACLDGSELGERVLPHALAVAEAFEAPLTLLRVLEGETPGAAPPDPVDWELRREEAREYLDRLVKAGGPSRAIEAELIEGRAADQICVWASHHEVGLTVVCTHGIKGQTEWSLASTARKVVDRAPGSLLLVPSASVALEGVARYHRILVPVDGSPRAESVIPLATRLAAVHGAELILAHVVPTPELTEIGPLDAADLALRDQLLRRNEHVANLYLDRLREQLGRHEFPVRALVLRGGDVRSRLVSLIADEAVDLVVLSAHGHSARVDVAFGSVTAHLVTHAATPLLVVRRRPAILARRVVTAARGNGARLPSQAGL